MSISARSRHRMGLWGCVLAAVLVFACGGAEPEPSRPNLLFVVWDTVRADRLSLYGHDVETTPHLDQWARKARVFEDVISPGASTAPAHASMFTGLLPSEHGVDNTYNHLDDSFVTLAERFEEGGYQTYLFAANPHIAKRSNFTQGFQVEEHPWDPNYANEAVRIVREKLSPTDQSSELPDMLRRGQVGRWSIKASGELAERGALRFLDGKAPGQPWMIFLNYMEAHRPFVPSEAARRKVMSDAEVRRSYEVDRSWIPMWRFVFGLHEYSEEELAIMATTYEATLVELDGLFHHLLESLRERGELDNTIVVLTADHGEHLGEHHLLDHQYSLYDGLLRVPLVLWYPKGVEAGREAGPVSTRDLYPTLLELAGLELPADSHATSLLRPDPERVRFAEQINAAPGPIQQVKQLAPEWDDRPWYRRLRAAVRGDWKLIEPSEGRAELFEWRVDPGEENNQIEAHREKARELAADLRAVEAAANGSAPTRDRAPREEELTPEERSRLEALGYLQPEANPSDAGDGADAPAPQSP